MMARLTRSQDDRKIGGVASGIAAYYGLDPTLVRVGFVISALWGFGFPLYLVLWLVLPAGLPATPAIRIAEERFARGEIGSDELDRIRADLTRPA
jgi:phage shock protein PspC (stress-responsive transcriptional regulator)